LSTFAIILYELAVSREDFFPKEVCKIISLDKLILHYYYIANVILLPLQITTNTIHFHFNNNNNSNKRKLFIPYTSMNGRILYFYGHKFFINQFLKVSSVKCP
jgi:hypothetical protein